MANGKIIARLKFGDSINKEILRAIDDEIRIAQNKFTVNLTVEEQEFVKSRSLEQLAEKITHVFKYQFPDASDKNAIFKAENIYNVLEAEKAGVRDLVIDFSDIIMIIKTPIKGSENKITLYHDKKPEEVILLERQSSGFEIAEEESEESIWLNELVPFLHDTIIKWAKTAAYYGVGSFSR